MDELDKARGRADGREDALARDEAGGAPDIDWKAETRKWERPRSGGGVFLRCR
ncbi:hypothetical protein HLV38_02940 [Berryella wangjianweii]|uniref:Uncharacterized protein n=1 Tax=Berryella wangjianweii TaxID=2734634 RepID=A0A6M8J117_9ACTN|nr:hypothetical protein [Berryella wangjianweii]QKF07194.1 hypothetical protein HLV38_02940 [Berryella wangjianweii]